MTNSKFTSLVFHQRNFHFAGYFNQSVIREQGNFLSDILTSFDCFIAGGYPVFCFAKSAGLEKLAQHGFGDIDFFFATEEERARAVEYVKKVYEVKLEKPVAYIGETINATTMNIHGLVWQFIKVRTGTVEEVLESFDFETAKIAIHYDKKSGEFLQTFSSEGTDLLRKGLTKFRRNLALMENPGEGMTLKTVAKSNMKRLDKYISRFDGFADDISRTQLLEQYAWDIYQSKMNYPPYELRKILMKKDTPLEDVVLFYTRGPLFKEIFDLRKQGIDATSSGQLKHPEQEFFEPY